LLASGIDPSLKRKAEKLSKHLSHLNTFEGIAREWHAKREPGWAKSHSKKVLSRLSANIFPWVGSRPIAEIEAPELLALLQRMANRGAGNSAERVRQYLSTIYDYAIANGKAKSNPARPLVGALPKAISHNYASITDPARICDLLRTIDTFQGHFATKIALALAPILFCRPGELRGMEWSEVDLKNALWKIPPERRKVRQAAKLSNRTGDHLVPLPRQAIALLEELRPLTGSGKFVFPSTRTRDRAMSDGTVNAALRRLGYDKEQITGHGFRHMASTLLNESRMFDKDVIEKQLSHQDDDAIRGYYNSALYLTERISMMQLWADYLDKLKSGKICSPIEFVKTSGFKSAKSSQGR
jgi:integrase